VVLYQQKVTVELNQRHLIVRVSTLRFPLALKFLNTQRFYQIEGNSMYQLCMYV
jgi:hypothetical protein